MSAIGEPVLDRQVADKHCSHHMRLAHGAPRLTIGVPVPSEVQVPQGLRTRLAARHLSSPIAEPLLCFDWERVIYREREPSLEGNLFSIPREEFAVVFHPEPVKDFQEVAHALFARKELPLRHISLQRGNREAGIDVTSTYLSVR